MQIGGAGQVNGLDRKRHRPVSPPVETKGPTSPDHAHGRSGNVSGSTRRGIASIIETDRKYSWLESVGGFGQVIA